ncbi:hypothetical protein INT45_001975 [Circinella minor]|uniref:Uncharacterized protein n=1 Tax=Circinella minor TaxID=1195481 RepID=A0A8H7VEQ0_9FUNG|nr:hypothetical protein INT45_001975 [Circinella minor]
MSSNNNNNNDNNARRQQHAERMAEVNFRRLQDECSSLRTQYAAMKNQMDAMSAYMASIQQQQLPPPPSQNPAPEMDRERVNFVIRNIHARHDLFVDGDGYNYTETFRSRHNKEVTSIISAYCKGSPGGCVLDDKALHNQILTFFHGQKKLAARKDAHQKYKASLEAQYPDGEKLLCRECMSPELSDAESEADGLVRLTPSFRKPNVNHEYIVERYFGELDKLSKGGRKRKGLEARERRVGGVVETPISEETVASWPDWAK